VRPIVLARSVIRQTQSLVAHNTAFIKNSTALAAGTGGAAVLGFVYWWLAAHTCTPQAVGVASAYLSLMGLVGLLGEAGLGTLLTGEIMRHPGRERALTMAAGCAALVMSGAAGAAALCVSQAASRSFSGGSFHDVNSILFVLGCCFTGLSLVIDQALLGMLQGVLRMLRQFLFSGCKLILLIAVTARFSNETAILLSWVAAQLVSLLLTALLARRAGRPAIEAPDFQLLGTLRVKVIDHYLLDVNMQAPGVILPYLVTVCLSATSNAAFSTLWMVFSVVAIVPASLATVLFPDVRAAPSHYRDKMVLSLRTSLVFATAFGFLVLLSSRQILSSFNPAYAQIAGNGLQFLGFGLVGAVVKFHVCAGARLTNSMRKAALWFCLGAVWELAAAVIGCRFGQLGGLTLAWVAAVMLEAVAMLIIASRRVRWTLVPPGAPARGNGIGRRGPLSGSQTRRETPYG
jgi:O-antigen/teichoic acid export membrane protein